MTPTGSERPQTRIKRMPVKTHAVMKVVAEEVQRATEKFPTWPTDPLHAVAVLNEEVGELNKAILQATYEPRKASPFDVRGEAVQAAAMAVRFLMSLDKYEYFTQDQHSQDD